MDEQTDRTKLVNLMQKLMERGYMTEQSGSDWGDATGEESAVDVINGCAVGHEF